MLNVAKLNVVILSVVMLNVVAPSGQPYKTLIAKITANIRVKNIMFTTLINLLTNICGQGQGPTLEWST